MEKVAFILIYPILNTDIGYYEIRTPPIFDDKSSTNIGCSCITKASNSRFTLIPATMT